MKKSKLKLAVKKAISKHYLNMGFTMTAYKLLNDIEIAIDKEYNKKHK